MTVARMAPFNVAYIPPLFPLLTQVWLRYAEMEMRNRFINHARNVWDRAVNLLPRQDQLW
jgi:hypothetical protein